MKKSNSFTKGLVAGLFTAFMLIVCVGGSFWLRSFVIAGSKSAQTSSQNTDSAQIGEKGHLEITPGVTKKMELIEKVVEDYYYKEEFDVEEMENGIYRGMLASLGDPYSEYFSKEELVELNKQTEGIFYGIGAVLTIDEDTGFGMIKEVKPDTAAQEAGVLDGDLIYEVDGVSTYGLSLSEIVSKVRGDENTQVVLTMIRDSAPEPIDITVTRRRVEEETVAATMYDNGIGYIQIAEFDQVTAAQFEENLKMLQNDGMQAMILDLRSNPGGNVNTVVDIARMILPEGMIVYTEDRDGNRTEYKCDGTRQLNMPLVVLINGASASASEILSGAIKDHGVGVLMGTTTFGKGIVQRVIGLSDGSAVKLTISTYFTPNGANIHGVGIKPDIECIFDANSYYDNRYDNQLEQARQYLSKELGVEYIPPENAPTTEENASVEDETTEDVTTEDDTE